MAIYQKTKKIVKLLQHKYDQILKTAKTAQSYIFYSMMYTDFSVIIFCNGETYLNAIHQKTYWIRITYIT